LGLSSASTNKTAAQRAKELEDNPELKHEHRDRDQGERPERGERADRGGDRAGGERGGRGGRGRGTYGGISGGFEKNTERAPYKKSNDAKGSDDSFEEVKEKKRGPATFSRGGKSYGGKSEQIWD